MKKILFILFWALCHSLMFSYTAKAEIRVLYREANVEMNYTFSNISNGNVRVTLPKRARISRITSPVRANLDYNKNDDVIWFKNLSLSGEERINIVYSLPISGEEFYLENWLPQTSQNCEITAVFREPDKFKGIFVPYRTKNLEGFVFQESDNPMLVCAKYNFERKEFGEQAYEFYYQFKLNTPLPDIHNIYKTYAEILNSQKQKTLILIHIANISNSVFYTENTLFVTVNNSFPSEIKKALASTWFREKLKLSADENFALIDLYKRLVGDNGQKETDDGLLIAVPSQKYYEDVLLKGFPKGGELECDTTAMLNNFSLLHFAYYTVGLDNFVNSIRNDVLSLEDVNNNAGVFQYLTNLNTANEAVSPTVVSYIIKNLLPVSKIMPDISVKQRTVYRNSDLIPDIQVSVDRVSQTLAWGNKRGVDLGNIKGEIQSDWANSIPQLNFFNDVDYTDETIVSERNAVFQFAANQKKYPNESYRDTLSLKRFIAPANNSFNIAKDSVVYIAVIKFFAPVRGKFTTGLKELIISMESGKPNVVYERIRL